MSDPSSAIATREESKSEVALRSPLIVTSVAGRGEVERIETAVTVPSNFQYVIPARKNNKQYDPDTRQMVDNWVDDNKVSLTSDGYDYVNRVLGASFWLPEQVPDEAGTMVSNPIHKPDYIYIRMGGVWYNAVGQLVTHMEDLEVNYRHVWYQARLKSAGAEQLLDGEGQPLFDQLGMPMLRLNDVTYPGKNNKPAKTVTGEEQERRAMEALMNLRAMGMRYAQTVLRVRILKVATGIKSLPIQQPRPFKLSIVGFRDVLDPSQRQAEAESRLTALYGKRAPEAEPLSHDDMAGIEPADVETSMEQVVQADSVAAVTPVGPEDDDEFDVERGN